MRHRRPSRGFTLIEVLVAFVIATGSLALLFAVHSRATGAALLSTDYGTATQLAKSLIAERSNAEHFSLIEGSGTFGSKYLWKLRAKELDSDTSADSDVEAPLRLVELTAEVSWLSRDRDRSIAITTVKPWPSVRRSDALGPQ